MATKVSSLSWPVWRSKYLDDHPKASTEEISREWAKYKREQGIKPKPAPVQKKPAVKEKKEKSSELSFGLVPRRSPVKEGGKRNLPGFGTPPPKKSSPKKPKNVTGDIEIIGKRGQKAYIHYNCDNDISNEECAAAAIRLLDDAFNKGENIPKEIFLWIHKQYDMNPRNSDDILQDLNDELDERNVKGEGRRKTLYLDMKITIRKKYIAMSVAKSAKLASAYTIENILYTWSSENYEISNNEIEIDYSDDKLNWNELYEELSVYYSDYEFVDQEVFREAQIGRDNCFTSIDKDVNDYNSNVLLKYGSTKYPWLKELLQGDDYNPSLRKYNTKELKIQLWEEYNRVEFAIAGLRGDYKNSSLRTQKEFLNDYADLIYGIKLTLPGLVATYPKFREYEKETEKQILLRGGRKRSGQKSKKTIIRYKTGIKVPKEQISPPRKKKELPVKPISPKKKKPAAITVTPPKEKPPSPKKKKPAAVSPPKEKPVSPKKPAAASPPKKASAERREFKKKPVLKDCNADFSVDEYIRGIIGRLDRLLEDPKNLNTEEHEDGTKRQYVSTNVFTRFNEYVAADKDSDLDKYIRKIAKGPQTYALDTQAIVEKDTEGQYYVSRNYLVIPSGNIIPPENVSIYTLSTDEDSIFDEEEITVALKDVLENTEYKDFWTIKNTWDSFYTAECPVDSFGREISGVKALVTNNLQKQEWVDLLLAGSDSYKDKLPKNDIPALYKDYLGLWYFLGCVEGEPEKYRFVKKPRTKYQKEVKNFDDFSKNIPQSFDRIQELYKLLFLKASKKLPRRPPQKKQ